MRSSWLWLVVALGLTSGCGSDKKAALVKPESVALTVFLDATVSDAQVATLKTLAVSDGSSNAPATYDLTATPFVARQLMVTFKADSALTSAVLVGRALDAGGDSVAQGQSATIALTPGQAVAGQLVLSTNPLPPQGDMGPTTTALTITPSSLTMAPGAIQPFTANLPVTWSVMEAAGGQIDGNGNYTAPALLGTYHVVATTTDAPTRTAVAAVLVDGRQVQLVAGALGGNGRADGIGSAARFHTPGQFAYDGAGHLYVADWLNETIRVVDTTTGGTTTLAGAAGQYGTSDGIGAAARFGGPMGLALDGKGNLYVADDASNVIRRVELATRTVTTISGAPGVAGYADGASAKYAVPASLAYDPAGFLYIADSNNSAIRKLDLSDNVASTINSDFLFPVGLAFDGTRYLYVADGREEAIGRVDTEDGLSTSLVGGEAGFRDGIGGHLFNVNQLALDAKNNILHIADFRVRTLDLQNLALATQQFEHDGIGYGIAIDENGDTLFGYDDAIIRIDSAGDNYTVVAGVEANVGYVDGTGTAARFANPRALASDGNGALFATDPGNQTVRRIALATGQTSTLAGSPWYVDADGVGTAGRLHYPQNVVSDGSGTLYIIESDTATIRKYVIATGTLTTLAGRANRPGNADGPGATAQFYEPMGACLDSGFLYVADSQNQTIRRVDVTTGAVTTIAGMTEQPGAVDTIGANAQFNIPEDVKCDGAGHLYVADWRNDAIRRVTLSATNTVDTVVGKLGAAGATNGLGGAARLNGPVALAINATTLFIADGVNDSIREARLSDFNVTTRAAGVSGGNITGIAVDGANLVYISSDKATVKSVDPSGAIAFVAGTANALPTNGQGAAAAFERPLGLWLDGGGLWLVDHDDGTVRHIDLPSANVTTGVGYGWSNAALTGTGIAANILRPHGIGFYGGALYVGDDVGTVLDQIDPTTTILTIAAGQAKQGGWDSGPVATAHIESVSSVIFDGQGALYMGDGIGCTIRAIVSGQLTTLAGMTANGNGSVGSTDGTGAAARFNAPEGIALDGSGNLYVADSWNHVIRKVELATGVVTTPYGKAGAPDAVDGLGTDARFDVPLDVVYDAGSLYVADSGNGAIRRIDLTTQLVTTYVGLLGQQGVITGALPARLNQPRGLIQIAPDQWAFIDEQAIFVIR